MTSADDWKKTIRLNKLFGLSVSSVTAPVMSDHQDHPSLVTCLYHLFPIGNGIGNRFFHIDVLSMLSGQHRLLCVDGVWGHQKDPVDIEAARAQLAAEIAKEIEDHESQD